MEKSKPHILYVEDDINLSFVTRDNLEMYGYIITCCTDGASALATFSQAPHEHPGFDLCILDVMLPKMDGFTVARHMREQNPHIPILFLSAKSMKEDRITGLRAGADDYITKPFSIEELVLRIEVFLKRSQISHQPSPSIFQLGRYQFQFDNLQLNCPEEKFNLTLKEGQLLRLFCLRTNQLLKREEILNTLWGNDDYFMGRSLDVFISRLRKYLRHDTALSLENVHRVGFVMRIK
ncbi:MAG: response regulator transcription factor [Bacteroidota bacterium]